MMNSCALSLGGPWPRFLAGPWKSLGGPLGGPVESRKFGSLGYLESLGIPFPGVLDSRAWSSGPGYPKETLYPTRVQM